MILAFKIGFLEVSWVDFIDIGLVAVLLYQVYKLIRGSIAVNIFLGILALYLVYLIVRAAQMELLTTILGQFMGVGVLATIILFQQEIRKFLLVIGRSTEFNRESLIKSFTNWRPRQKDEFDIREVIEAAKTLKATRTGALIVFSRDSGLKFYVETGDPVDSVVSRRILLSIFNKNSPLHDGAIIIHKGKIKAARCVLPVSENDHLPPQFGLRHRSAIGMSESTDTLLLAISEETGRLILARNGVYLKGLKLKQVEQKILEYLHDEEPKDWALVGHEDEPQPSESQEA
ncbi:MAG TPA: diadenylate cyclase CdaA [Cyclobacteriaceae bacterium]|nr:diadenylate cyclase CdaA [Cyclobacteriaceae bacterium]MCB9237318.1 TIGR00159 family protein [Flammeovirgaceae bacterium]MCB0500253.1 diadenylate cyclase CdaA [Cyclobacteriaceae bacterium]MCO5271028.1 diadenylate cyclase CdaA [Cyclobacteriaceae bacterium]MCW5903405.1 diadenylate cyclase CdaA [Cyclobacteriaceae bacterium]